MPHSPKKSSPPRPSDERRYERIFEADQQLHLVVDDHELMTINWSTGGCLVDCLPEWKKGDTVAGSIETLIGVPMGAVVAEILRIDDQGRAALRFITIAPLSDVSSP